MDPESLLQKPQINRKLTTGCPIIDGCIRGGIPCKSVTEIVAESGCGKTQLCLSLSLTVQLPLSRGGLHGSALYLHTEFPFPSRRLHQLARLFHQSNPETYADFNDNPCDHVFVRSVHTAYELLDVMPQAQLFIQESKTRFPVKLIVVDSIAALFRSEFDNNAFDLKKRSSLFFKISGKLKELANKFDLAVVITNQVVDVIDPADGLNGLRVGNMKALYSSGRRVCPALGIAWANCVNSRLFLSRNEEIVATENAVVDENGHHFVHTRTRKQLHVIFSPHMPGSSCEFVIKREGVFGVNSSEHQCKLG